MWRNNYFDAYISKNVTDMMEYSVDENYLDEVSREKALTRRIMAI